MERQRTLTNVLNVQQAISSFAAAAAVVLLSLSLWSLLLLFKKKKPLVTGSGGSIGSELCRHYQQLSLWCCSQSHNEEPDHHH